MRWIALLLTVAPLSSATLTAGPWTVDYDAGRLGAVTYGGVPVSTMASVGGYRPDYSGSRFGLANTAAVVERTADGATLTFPLDKPGQVQGSLRLELAGDRATWRLDAQVEPAGPVEFGVLVPEATVRRSDGGLTIQQGTRTNTFDARRFASFGTGRELLFDRPAATLTWSLESQPGSWQCQDHRAETTKAIRIIAVAPVGQTTTRVQAAATLTVRAWPAAEQAGRALLLDQRSRWADPVEVPNAGFEAGAEGWAVPGNGAVEATGAKDGQRAARLTVADPLKDSVYITRQVPIVGGSHYQVKAFVKTTGVTAKEGKMASVGAGLIVEWADREGKWFASGAYACDLYGDKDWTLRETDLIRAPEEAGYAVIFLALRGAGTAWFDQVEVTRVHRALALLAPLSGARLPDNTPTFAWREDAQAMDYTLQVSRDQQFPEAATQRLTVPDPRATWRTPLAPGTWYWRVGAQGYDPSAVWSFEQSAPVDQDTTAPEVTAQPTRVLNAAGPVAVDVAEAGDRAPTVTAKAGDQAVAVTVQPRAAGQWAATLTGPWPAGLSTVQVVATDAAGNQGEASCYVLNRPRPASPVVIDELGRYQVAGQPAFPFGIYQVSPAAMPTVKRAGFDVVHTYAFESSQDDGAAKAYLDAAAAAGLRVFIGFDRGGGTGRGMVQGNRDHLAQRVAALCDHPGLFCWYLFDEPEIAHQYIAPRTLNAYGDLVRRLDPYHAVVMTTWGPRMALYRPSFDTHWTQAYTTPDGVVRQLQEHRKLLGEACPVSLLVHCYDRKQSALLKNQRPVDETRFEPDPDWLRGAAYAGATQRINGLWWWWYADTAADWLTIADIPEMWDALSEVVGELTTLEPVLAAPEPAETGSLDVPGGQAWWYRKTTGGRTTGFVVNTTTQRAEVTMPWPGADALEGLFGTQGFERTDGGVKTSLGRYGVALFRSR